jgi:hypothetical protein
VTQLGEFSCRYWIEGYLRNGGHASSFLSRGLLISSAASITSPRAVSSLWASVSTGALPLMIIVAASDRCYGAGSSHTNSGSMRIVRWDRRTVEDRENTGGCALVMARGRDRR